MAGRARGGAGLDLWVLLLAAFVVGIGLPLIGLKVFLGTDLPFTRAPWNAVAPAAFTPRLPCVSDTVDSDAFQLVGGPGGHDDEARSTADLAGGVGVAWLPTLRSSCR